MHHITNNTSAKTVETVAC